MELVFSVPTATARLSLVSRAAVAAPADRAGAAGASATAGAALLVDQISRADSNALALAQVEAAFGTEFFLSSAVTRNRFVALVSIALTIE
jgi:hypothetical protein